MQVMAMMRLRAEHNGLDDAAKKAMQVTAKEAGVLLTL